jgi:hypothetical protein
MRQSPRSSARHGTLSSFAKKYRSPRAILPSATIGSSSYAHSRVNARFR